MEIETDDVAPANLAELRRNQIREFVTSRNIRHLVHFTQASDVSSILIHGLLSRDLLDQRGLPYSFTDAQRLDGHKDASCLSIDFPNSLMFYAKRQQLSQVNCWAVVRVKSSVLWELDCAFFYMNAAHHLFRDKPVSQFKTFSALKQLFACSDQATQQSHFGVMRRQPADVQAEVLVFDPISPDYIVDVHVENNDHTLGYVEQWGCRHYVVSRRYFRPRQQRLA